MALSPSYYFCERKRERAQTKELLNQVKGYDVVIMDCAPTLGLLPINAIMAADRFIVPAVSLDISSPRRSNYTDRGSRKDKGRKRRSASTTGILLTQVDKRNKSTLEIISLIRQRYGNEVFKTEVKTNTRLFEAPSFGKTIFQHDWQQQGHKHTKR